MGVERAGPDEVTSDDAARENRGQGDRCCGRNKETVVEGFASVDMDERTVENICRGLAPWGGGRQSYY